MKKICILGSNGMAGHMIERVLSEHQDISVTGLTHSDFDVVDDEKELFDYLNSHSFDYIINCVGVIKPMIEDIGVEKTVQINSIFPQKLGKKFGNKVIHLSTDCIFNGEKGNYKTDDKPSAQDVYGMTKYLGEKNNGCVNIRTSIIGPEKGDRSRSLLEWVFTQENSEIGGYINHFWNGVTTLELTEFIKEIILNKDLDSGVYQFGLKTPISKYELIQKISEVYNLGIDLQRVKTNKTIDRSFVPDFVARPIKTQLEELKNE